jgi:hypothetical protein
MQHYSLFMSEEEEPYIMSTFVWEEYLKSRKMIIDITDDWYDQITFVNERIEGDERERKHWS